MMNTLSVHQYALTQDTITLFSTYIYRTDRRDRQRISWIFWDKLVQNRLINMNLIEEKTFKRYELLTNRRSYVLTQYGK